VAADAARAAILEALPYWLSVCDLRAGPVDIFRQGMGALGYLEDRDFVLEARFAHRDYGRFPNLVEELLNAFQDLERLPAGLDGPRRPL
jgi:hypothetical protein